MKTRAFTIIELAFAVLSSASLMVGVGLFYKHVRQTLTYIDATRNHLILRTELMTKMDCAATQTVAGPVCDALSQFNLNYVAIRTDSDTLIPAAFSGTFELRGYQLRVSCRNAGDNFVRYQIDSKLAQSTTNGLLKKANEWAPASAIPIACPARTIYFYNPATTTDFGIAAMKRTATFAFEGPFALMSPGSVTTIFNDPETQRRLCALRDASIVDFFYPMSLSTSCSNATSTFWDSSRHRFFEDTACGKTNHMVRLRCRRY